MLIVLFLVLMVMGVLPVPYGAMLIQARLIVFLIQEMVHYPFGPKLTDGELVLWTFIFWILFFIGALVEHTLVIPFLIAMTLSVIYSMKIIEYEGRTEFRNFLEEAKKSWAAEFSWRFLFKWIVLHRFTPISSFARKKLIKIIS